MYLILLSSPLTYYYSSKYYSTYPETRCLKRKLGRILPKKAKKYTNTFCKSIYTKNTKSSIDRIKRQ